jgi:hypothetical protein
MALKNVDETGKLVSSTKMTVGEKVTGYVTGFSEGQFGTNLVMQNEAGETFTLLAAKHIQYKIADKKIKLGQYTEITRLADKKVGGGKSASQFTVLQDADRTVPIDSSPELTAAGITADAAPVASIKERAAKLQVKN